VWLYFWPCCIVTGKHFSKEQGKHALKGYYLSGRGDGHKFLKSAFSELSTLIKDLFTGKIQ
jgi:hypothetical protein